MHQPHEVPRYANGPMRYGRSMPFGSRRRPPPSSPGESGLITLNGVSFYQGADGSAVWATPDGSLEWIHNTAPGSNRTALLFFSMRSDPLHGGGDGPADEFSDVNIPPADVFFGTQEMEYIDFNATSLIFHGYYHLHGLTQQGVVTVSFNPRPGIPGTGWWCMMHLFTFNGAMQAAPVVRNRMTFSRTASTTLPYSPTALTSENGSWIVDSVSGDEDVSVNILTDGDDPHVKRTQTRVGTSDGEDAWTRAHVLACGTSEHPSVGTYTHPWWWTGGNLAGTYYAVEIRPAT